VHFVADLIHGGARSWSSAPDLFDPRPDPTGRRIAYVADGASRGRGRRVERPRARLHPGPDIHWGWRSSLRPKRWSAPRLLVVPRR
jgi:dipeptidyl-peptidase-4